MRCRTGSLFGCALALGLLMVATVAQAQQHRATHLGNPTTRFAPPLASPTDLRALFRDPKLQPDIAAILRQSGWQGHLQDLHAAAATAQITDMKIHPGARLPFMSSRAHGQPVLLRDVLWAGTEPIEAYAFVFASNGQLYRCVTPRVCSNFFVEDFGSTPAPEPVKTPPVVVRGPVLALDCDAPSEVLLRRPVKVCLTVKNTGEAPEPQVTLTLPIPPGVLVASTSDGGTSAQGRVSWTLAQLVPGTSKQVCAVLTVREPGSLAFAPSARGQRASPVESRCATQVVGVPAILLEVVDLRDPIEIGSQVTYDIKVLNQGTAPISNVRLVCTIPDTQEYLSGQGVTPLTARDRTVVTQPIPRLLPKAEAVWRVTVKALQAGDTRFKVELSGDQFPQPIVEYEATRQY